MMETMKVKNPLSDFLKSPKDGSKNTWEQATALFIVNFLQDLNQGVYAVDEKLNKIELGKEGADHYNVDKVAGFWRIQKKLPYKITRVRDKDMVLIKKLDRVENTLFDFWSAKMVSYNCYGPFIIDIANVDYIVAQYETDKKTYLGYGRTIEAARAYLGLKLYDEYKDVINAIACKKQVKQLTK
ncbi:MAG: hypothetical protein ACLRFQ_02890 [Alphaproteobacteria bacterium]